MNSASWRTATLFIAIAVSAPNIAFSEDTYRVSVTRVGQDLYGVDGTDFIVKTRYCYQYSYSEDAILIIESSVGFTIGRLVFIDQRDECDVEKILS